MSLFDPSLWPHEMLVLINSLGRNSQRHFLPFHYTRGSVLQRRGALRGAAEEQGEKVPTAVRIKRVYKALS